MRVLHVGFYCDPARRRPEELLREWRTLTHNAEGAASAGIEMLIVQAAHEKAVIRFNGIECHFVLPAEVIRCAVELKPDVLHVRSLSFPLQTRALGRRIPRAPIVVGHHADRVPPPLRRPLHRWGLANVSGCVCTNRLQMQPFLEKKLVPSGMRIFEMPEASSRFTPGDQAEARRATGMYGDPCLLWVGRLDNNKDPLTILNAVSRAAQHCPDIQLWCAYTDTPLLDAVKDRIRADNSLASRVHLLGAVPYDKVEQLCRAADFFVLGSASEATCFAAIEALACGTTPIVSDIPAFRFVTRNASVGALFEVGNATALAEHIVAFAGRDRAQQRTAARAHFDDFLSIPAMGPSLRGIYETLLSDR